MSLFRLHLSLPTGSVRDIWAKTARAFWDACFGWAFAAWA